MGATLDRDWLVELARPHTAKDIESGAMGFCAVKSVLVRCPQDKIKETLKIDDRWEIKSVVDYEVMCTRQTLENIRWIFSH